jgi:hypothetical protein
MVLTTRIVITTADVVYAVPHTQRISDSLELTQSQRKRKLK